MANCDHCNIPENERIFEDGNAIVTLSPQPAGPGHVLVIPNEHFTILEQVPDFIAGHLFSIANKMSTTLFERMRVNGTNVIAQNGIAAGQKIAHFAINVIPRTENDGLGFNWQPVEVSEEELATVELQLKEESKSIGDFEKEGKKPIKVEDKQKELVSGSKEDYKLRQLRRLP